MHTRCPHCDTCFRVTPEHLALAEGAVRCGRCFNTFNARDYLIDSPQGEGEPEEKTEGPHQKQTDNAVETTPALDSSTAPQEKEKETLVDSAQIVDSEPTEIKEETSDSHNHSDHALDVLHEIENRSAEDKRRSARRTVAGLSVIALLIITLIGQYLYVNRNTLAQNTDARPWLSAVCAIAGCDIPLLRMPEQIKLVDRGIRKHPKHSNALLVEAEMVNKAPFVQAYPIIKLTLQDITGRVLSGRSFTADEYLPKNIDQREGMAPGKNVKVALVLVDPGDEAVGFEFEFH